MCEAAFGAQKLQEFDLNWIKSNMLILSKLIELFTLV